MTFYVLSFLIILCSFSRGTPLGIRIPNTNATCQPEYSWMNNAEQRSPCLMVAYVIAACVGDTWTQPALPSGSSYDSPNGTTATPCYCSWSCYNLMMACTLCQNMSEITTWPAFSQNCPSSYKDEMFPQGYVLADNFSIPYWATTNPTNWTFELFNVEQAESYANQNISDVWPSVSAPHSSSSSSGSSLDVGAIIGAIVGGAAGVLLIVICGIFLYKRWQSRRLQNTNDVSRLSQTATPLMNTHARWASSDSSAIFSQAVTTSPSMSYMAMQSQGISAGASMHQPTLYSTYPGSSPPPETSSFFTTENPSVLPRTRTIPIL